jgi:hypothetical protein
MTCRQHNLHDDCRELECLESPSMARSHPRCPLSHTHVSSRCPLFSVVLGRCASLHVSLLLSQCTLLHNVTIHPLVRGHAGESAACMSHACRPRNRDRNVDSKPAKRGKHTLEFVNRSLCTFISRSSMAAMNLNKLSVEDVDLAGKRVLIRVRTTVTAMRTCLTFALPVLSSLRVAERDKHAHVVCVFGLRTCCYLCVGAACMAWHVGVSRTEPELNGLCGECVCKRRGRDPCCVCADDAE